MSMSIQNKFSNLDWISCLINNLIIKLEFKTVATTAQTA